MGAATEGGQILAQHDGHRPVIDQQASRQNQQRLPLRSRLIVAARLIRRQFLHLQDALPQGWRFQHLSLARNQKVMAGVPVGVDRGLTLHIHMQLTAPVERQFLEDGLAVMVQPRHDLLFGKIRDGITAQAPLSGKTSRENRGKPQIEPPVQCSHRSLSST